MDFYYNGKEEGEDGKEEDATDSPAIVLYDGRTKAMASWVMESKSITEGGPNDWVPKVIVQEIEAWGYGHRKIILASDGEPSILVVKDKVTELRRGETVPEESPVGEHQANLAENAVKRVREQTRTILGSIEEKCGARIDRKSPAMQWLVRWAATLVSRYQMGEDGKTPYERIRGRKCKGPIAMFGERVLYKELNDGRGDRRKIETTWKEGVWLGIKNRTGEHIIGTPEGAVKAYSVRRRPEEERWSVAEVNAVRGTPGCPKPGRHDTRVPVRVRETQDPLPERAQPEELRARRIYYRKADFEKAGYTQGCEGCVRLQDGRDRRPHKKECVERMNNELEQTAEGRERLRKAEERMNEGIARQIEINDNNMNEDVVIDNDDRESRGDPSGDGEQDGQEMRDDNDEAMLTWLRRAGVGHTNYLDILGKWDFNNEQDRADAKRYIDTVKPMMVVGSPTCAAFSQIQTFNWGKNRERDRKLKEALRAGHRHMDFMMEIYKTQMDNGRYFVHENPVGASSWRSRAVEDVQSQEEVLTVTGDQCEMGVKTRDKFGPGAVKKPTKYMTNSVHVAQELAVRCKNEERGVSEQHRHIPLTHGRTGEHGDEYRVRMCEAIDRGVKTQMEADKFGTIKVVTVEAGRRSRMKRDMMRSLKRIVQDGRTEDGHERRNAVDIVAHEVEEWCDGDKKLVAPQRPEEEEDSNEWVAYDDVSGAALNPKHVQEARQVEMEYFKKMNVYTKVSRWDIPAGTKVVKVKWIDINKGDTDNPVMRSRLVAMEFNDGDRPELYAGTPPTEALRMLISMAATSRKDKKENLMMVNDVSRAYFYAKVKSEIFVELPLEDKSAEDMRKDNVGRLNLSLYGTREAALNWQDEVAEHLTGIGFVRGSASSCIYHHPERSVATLVHGDDYASTGAEEDLKWLKGELEGRFEIKTTMIGHGVGCCKELKVLNRVIRATPEGWEYEGDQRHGEIIVRETGMGSAKGVLTAGEDCNGKEVSEEALGEKAKTWYRGVAARANYYSNDRPEIAYPVKEACRAMSAPTARDEKRMKRLGRYLVGSGRIVQRFRFQESDDTEVRVFTDSDWAGCDRTRKSTSGGAVMRGKHCIKFWSKTQQTIAMSSGEAELIALVKGCCEGIGAQSYMADAGIETGKLQVHADASAALGVVHRTGIGKIRHLDVAMLWIQQKQWKKRIGFNKVNGKLNPADMFTKNVPREICDQHLQALDFHRRDGRAAAAAKLVD